ncbi:MAG: helix-turn-helix domain-containing protein [Lachnospiraceae bacterium]|nr:helix-turn-helix domain-containing protein [Lachnospiraceae bacterium]
MRRNQIPDTNQKQVQHTIPNTEQPNQFRLDKRIKQFREERGYSVNKLANRAGVSQSYLRDIELGGKNPTIDFIALICDALGITLKEFFDDDYEPRTWSDPLIDYARRLTPEQQSALSAFLESMRSE